MSDTTASIDASSTKQPTEKGWAIAKRAAKAQSESYSQTHDRVSAKLTAAGLPKRDANGGATAIARLEHGHRLSPGDVQALNTAIQAKAGGSNGK